MLGFGALGQFALGEGPFAQSLSVGSQWQTPVRRTGLAVAVLATTFAGFVAPPPAQARVFSQFSQPQLPRINLPDELPSALLEVRPPPVISIAFAQFSQPSLARIVIPDEQPSALFEILPPIAPPFTGFTSFDGIIKARFNIALTAWQWWQPIILPVDTHDGVWVKRKKRSGRDPIDLELEEKASRRAALELAVYGLEKPIAQPKPVKAAVINSLPDVADLAKTVLLARQAHQESIRNQANADDEDDLESILREIL